MPKQTTADRDFVKLVAKGERLCYEYIAAFYRIKAFTYFNKHSI